MVFNGSPRPAVTGFRKCPCSPKAHDHHTVSGQSGTISYDLAVKPQSSRPVGGHTGSLTAGSFSQIVRRMGMRRVTAETIVLAGFCCRSFRQEVGKTYKQKQILHK